MFWMLIILGLSVTVVQPTTACPTRNIVFRVYVPTTEGPTTVQATDHNTEQTTTQNNNVEITTQNIDRETISLSAGHQDIEIYKTRRETSTLHQPSKMTSSLLLSSSTDTPTYSFGSSSTTPRSSSTTPRSSITTPRSSITTPRSSSTPPRSSITTPRSSNTSPRYSLGSSAATPTFKSRTYVPVFHSHAPTHAFGLENATASTELIYKPSATTKTTPTDKPALSHQQNQTASGDIDLIEKFGSGDDDKTTGSGDHGQIDLNKKFGSGDDNKVSLNDQTGRGNTGQINPIEEFGSGDDANQINLNDLPRSGDGDKILETY